MDRKLFGTDGIRGTANVEPMTADIALKVAMAAGLLFRNGHEHETVVIGKDTRLSGYLLESALTAGFVSMGMNVALVGPLPTPAIAVMTRSLRASLGVVLSASHNPAHDNGIKLFGPDGYKLSDRVEHEIEANMEHVNDLRVSAHQLGRARRIDDVIGRYVEYAKGSFPRMKTLDGLKIVVDCANGAAYKAAPTVLWELGAHVVPIGVSPNGLNINDGCGATSPAALQQAVVEHGADIGIALDGDADRVQLVDEKGRLIDGDQVMALIARSWKKSGRLTCDAVVATVMSNLGLERYLSQMGLTLIRTKVGDRYVVEQMRAQGVNLGGEQSGHIVLSDYSTTGDGLIAALQVLAVLIETGRRASEVLTVFEPYPQVLRNVRLSRRDGFDMSCIDGDLRQAEAKLATTGRILIRKSGTEPVVRVMAEGENRDLIVGVVDDLTSAIERQMR